MQHASNWRFMQGLLVSAPGMVVASGIAPLQGSTPQRNLHHLKCAPALFAAGQSYSGLAFCTYAQARRVAKNGTVYTL